MIISSKIEVTEAEEIDEEKEMMMHTPVRTVRAILGFEDFSSSLNINQILSNDISLIKKATSKFEKVNESSIVILEQSMAAHGFAVTEQINPLHEDVKLAFTSTTNFWIGVGYLL